ncbi:hypothetical protein [Alkalicoccus daliensis]|uniref:Uncharacterized protein n=1 Tax=Alkalicoccus daliensis TaxID=745820 RepID=A0A1H0ITN9_9BACI|nr:hypothetical protein [Alkalicoccus daliensis]SDO34421.1 hypothetical protein SAMN04488053_11189 [Alkalicoccus daliensis]
MTLRKEEIISQVTEKIYAADPALMEKYGEKGVERCREDNEHHLNQLSAAFTIRDANMFIDYAKWLNEILQRYGMKTKHLTDNFRYIQEALAAEESEKSETWRYYLQRAIESLETEEAS